MAVGAATILGSFAARLGIDTNDYGRGVLQAQAMNSAFGQSFTNFITNPLLGSIELFKKAAAGTAGLATATLSQAEATNRLAQQTGATTQLIQAMNARMEVAGFNAEQGGKSLLVLARTMREARENGGPLKDLFESLGVSLAPGHSLDEGLAQLLDGLYALPDRAERSAIAMKLLGEEAGPRLVNAIGGGRSALEEMIAEARDFGEAWDDNVTRTLDAGNTSLGYFTRALQGVRSNLTAQFLKGFFDEFGTGTDQARELARTVNGELGPSIREFGGDVARLTGNVDELVDSLDSLLKLLKVIEPVVDKLGDAFELAGEGTVDGQTPIGALRDPRLRNLLFSPLNPLAPLTEIVER